MTAPTANGGRGESRVPYPTQGWARALSFLLAVALSTLVLLYPRVLADLDSSVRPALLAALMWGTAGGFVHGVGFVPRHAIGRIVFHPALAWPIMIANVLMLVLNR